MKKTKIFRQEPAVVSFRKGATINLGNYESSRFEIGMSVPCDIKDIKKELRKLKKEIDKEILKIMREDYGIKNNRQDKEL